jgi:protein Hikeshi
LTSVSADKPSAIFRIKNSAVGVQNSMDMDEMVDDDRIAQYNIKVGISIVPLSTAQNELEALKSQQGQMNQQALVPHPITAPTAPTNPNDIAILANRIVQHAYNFLSGFTTPDGKVPMKAFDEWWNKFKARLATNPKFLESLE